VFGRDELHAIAELCQANDVVVVTDEIYDRILYDGHHHVSIGSLEGMQDRTVTISGLGKTYAVTGWRIGWAVACERLTASIRKVHDYLTICAPAPFQGAGIVALGLPETYYEQMCAEYAARREILMAALDAVGLPYCRPEGAYYVMLDLSAVNWPQERFSRSDWSPDRAFAEYMAREVGVAVVPGSSFYAEQRGGTDRVRINFAKRESTLREAALRLRRLATGCFA
jgi:aspartate/methionine/tyrosine aminotransferase